MFSSCDKKLIWRGFWTAWNWQGNLPSVSGLSSLWKNWNLLSLLSPSSVDHPRVLPREPLQYQWSHWYSYSSGILNNSPIRMCSFSSSSPIIFFGRGLLKNAWFFSSPIITLQKGENEARSPGPQLLQLLKSPLPSSWCYNPFNSSIRYFSSIS